MPNKKDISILIGNALDKFDTSMYSFLAPIMAPLFFPGYDPIVQLIFMYTTSITVFFTRPCGTLLFAKLASYYGPLYALLYSLMGVGVTTIMIGCIPSYEVVGWIAPLSLVTIRLVRGICASGESAVAKLYIMEGKSDNDALRISYFYQSSSMMGIVMSSAVSTIIIGRYIHMWRICFLLGGVTTLVALYIRIRWINQDKKITDVVYQGFRGGSMSMVWQQKNNIIRVALATIFSHITYSVPFVFMNSFVPLVTNISLHTMMQFNTAMLVIDMLAIPCVGYCIVQYNAKHVMRYASLIVGCTIVPLFYYMPIASLGYIVFVRIWIVVWGVVFLCPLNFWSKNLFFSSEQYFLVGVGNTLGAAILGHITTPLCLWLWYVTRIVWAPAVYIALIMLLAWYAVKSSEYSLD